METILSLMGKGIYCISNKVNGKVYIGSSVRMEKRKSNHKSALRRNIHKSKHLQNAWNKYGEDAFVFSCLEQVDASYEELLEIEKQWIQKLQATNREYGYNIRIDVVTQSGWKHTEETKRKISLMVKGKNLGKKYKVSKDGLDKKRIIALELQKFRTSETEIYRIQQVRKARTGKPLSAVTKKKLSESNSGTNNGMAVLTEDEVMQIKILLRDTIRSQQKIADQFQVSRELISLIKLGKRWKNVQIPSKYDSPHKDELISITSGNFEMIYTAWKNKQIRAGMAVKLSGLSKWAFYRKIRESEGLFDNERVQRIS
jgi:group I intron endonuclease